MQDANRLRLLEGITALLAMADEAGETVVAIHLDHARVAAGGNGSLTPEMLGEAEPADGLPIVTIVE